MSARSADSNRASSMAPRRVVTTPVRLISTSAGWLRTPKRANTLPASSSIWGNVSPCFATNPANERGVPDHATPMKLTLPAHCLLAASTEGASWLQVVQVGAQNQSATGRPARVAARSSPPPTRGAVNCSTFGTLVSPGTADAEGTLVSPGAAGAGLAVVRSDPHPAASAIADTTHSTIRIRGVRLDSRSGRRRTKRSCHLSRPIQPRPVFGDVRTVVSWWPRCVTRGVGSRVDAVEHLGD